MPPVSQAQRRWAYATKEGKTDTAPSVGEKFLGHGIKGLPERAAAATKAKKLMAKRKGK
jgi:hypothetical protein